MVFEGKEMFVVKVHWSPREEQDWGEEKMS